MGTLKGSLAILFWAMLFILTCQTMFAFLLNNVIMTYYLKPEGDVIMDRESQERVFTYFGTWTRSMWSMFELTFGNFTVIARVLSEDLSEWFWLFSVFHKMLFGYAVLGIVNGIFVRETFKVAECDDYIMTMQKERARKLHCNKMAALFRQADFSRDGLVDEDEFCRILEIRKVSTWLSAHDLDASNAKVLFRLLGQGKSKLSVD